MRIFINISMSISVISDLNIFSFCWNYLQQCKYCNAKSVVNVPLLKCFDFVLKHILYNCKKIEMRWRMNKIKTLLTFMFYIPTLSAEQVILVKHKKALIHQIWISAVHLYLILWNYQVQKKDMHMHADWLTETPCVLLHYTVFIRP